MSNIALEQKNKLKLLIESIRMKQEQIEEWKEQIEKNPPPINKLQIEDDLDFAIEQREMLENLVETQFPRNQKVINFDINYYQGLLTEDKDMMNNEADLVDPIGFHLLPSGTHDPQIMRWLRRFMKRSDDSSLVGKWLERDCAEGTVCVMVDGHVACQDERFVLGDCA